MPNSPPSSGAVLEALEQPALIVRRGIVVVANSAAKAILGKDIETRDVRLTIRHPLALETILAGRVAKTDFVGIGSHDQPWQLSVRPLDDGTTLVMLSDRSAFRSAEQMRTDFVANASHELRTPLSAIMGYAETLAEEAPLPDTMRQQFGATIQAESKRMLRIIEDLMSLSRIEADRFRLPSGRVNLGDIARTAAQNVTHLASQRGCVVKVAVDPDLPPVRGDLGQLTQVADNLVANAIRYGCSSAAASVDVTVRREGRRVVLAVRDYGEGIDPDHLPRLTERFYRVDNARSRDSGGTGLGLAIVKHIVERHRGLLDIRSSLGKGTEVRVALEIG